MSSKAHLTNLEESENTYMSSNYSTAQMMDTVHMEVDGRKVTLNFPMTPNPEARTAVRALLVDSILKKSKAGDLSINLSA